MRKHIRHADTAEPYRRRVIGLGVQRGSVDGSSLCRMFNQVIAGTGLPRRLSFDNAPLFDFAQWKANLRILEIDPIRSVPNVPVSHPFIERLIGTVRREFLDHLFYWNSADLFRKLDSFKTYYYGIRVHQGIQGDIPDHEARDEKSPRLRLGITLQRSLPNAYGSLNLQFATHRTGFFL